MGIRNRMIDDLTPAPEDDDDVPRVHPDRVQKDDDMAKADRTNGENPDS
jgi:hypothetical protein